MPFTLKILHEMCEKTECRLRLVVPLQAPTGMYLVFKYLQHQLIFSAHKLPSEANMVSHFALTGVSGLVRQRTRHHRNLQSLKQII